MAEWVAAGAMLLSAGVSAYEGEKGYELQKDAQKKQEEAQEKAAQAQKDADDIAERQRLEALVSNQTATDYGNVWGVENAKYADVAQKLSAGTGDFNTEDEETNPFYTRGLL